MEEQRIGMMYWNLFKRRLSGMWDGMFPRGLRRSSALPVLIVVAVIGIPGLGYYLHMRGKFASLKREIKGEQQGPPPGAIPRPGGLDPIMLTRAQTAGSNMPEFRTVTLLPGLGMSVLQITASIPDRGEMPLLAAPTVEEIAGGSATRSGLNDTHGALEAPWGGLLTGLLSPVGTNLRAVWRGRTIDAPTDVQGHATAYGGMLGAVAADTIQGAEGESSGSVDSGASATFNATDFSEHWVSKTNVVVKITLSARALELTVTAKNVGDQPEPMGLGWHPRLLMPSGERGAMELRMPGGEEVEAGDRAKGTPSGRIVAASTGAARFQGHPAALGTEPLDVNLVHLKPALLDSGIEADVRDQAAGVGLRMIAVSPTIRAFRAEAPAGANYVEVGTQTNFDDPLGKEWSGAEPQAIATLMPGQTLEWKVRLEIFSIMKK